MNTSIEIIKKSQYQSSTWSGGTTTQLLIYPEGASYTDRNFKWRLSSARVEAEESVFTHLPGIFRIIMPIDDELVLEHEGKYSVVLKPFEQDSFRGDWTTKSYGKATDFNLMLGEGCRGELNALSVGGRSSLDVMVDARNGHWENVTNAFYAVNGDLELKINNEKCDMQAKSLLSITQSYIGENLKVEFINNSNREVKVIQAVICY